MKSTDFTLNVSKLVYIFFSLLFISFTAVKSSLSLSAFGSTEGFFEGLDDGCSYWFMLATYGVGLDGEIFTVDVVKVHICIIDHDLEGDGGVSVGNNDGDIGRSMSTCIDGAVSLHYAVGEYIGTVDRDLDDTFICW